MRKFFFALFLPLLVISLVLFQQSAFAESPQPPKIPNGFSPERILVKFKPTVTQDTEERIHREFGTRIKAKIPRINVKVMEVPKSKVLDLVERYRANPNVEYAEPDFTAYALDIPNDSSYPLQWGMDKILAPAAWDISYGSAQVKIAVLDTGIDRDHEDLFPKIVDRANFTDSPSDDDIYGHGTHVAGIASAATNNNSGVAGLGREASLMSVKVLNDSGSGYYSWIANGITYAADNGAKVINLSLGGSSGSTTLKNALDYAWSKGIVISCAAGNNGTSAPVYPGYYANCIATAATNQSDQKTSWSTYGSWVDVAAPGLDIFSTLPNHPYNMWTVLNYGYLSGTSMATPHVAGLAGLLFGFDPLLTNTQVRSAIENYSDAIAGTGTYWRFGRINAYRALLSLSTPEASPSPTPEPTPTPSPSPTPSPTPTPTPTPTISPTPTPTPTPSPSPFAATITKHTVSTSWSSTYKGRVNITFAFKVNSGTSNQVLIKELTDQIGAWKPYQNSTRVVVYINGKRYRPNMVWDSANEISTVNIGALKTLISGDDVEVRMTLGNDTRGSHSVTGEVWDSSDILGQNLVNFTL